jgi:tRNA dimethylallyltransferase
MTSSASKWLITIEGPTAVGKTAMSLALGKYWNSPIISADARQCYREMKIGTARPSQSELEIVPHFFIADRSIKELTSAGSFESEALEWINQIHASQKENQVAIVAGGSWLYIKALLYGLDKFPDTETKIREKVNSILNNEGLDAATSLLQEHDPEYYAKVDKENPRRIARALEVYFQTGKTYSSFLNSEEVDRPFNIVRIGLQMDRDLLYQRIDTRVEEMMKQELLEEVKILFDKYSDSDLRSLDTVGYRELFMYLKNEITLEEAVDLIKRNTRRYAKRQLTYLRKQENINWYSPLDSEKVIDFINEEINTRV